MSEGGPDQQAGQQIPGDPRDMTDRGQTATDQGAEKDEGQRNQQWQKRFTHRRKISQLPGITKRNTN